MEEEDIMKKRSGLFSRVLIAIVAASFLISGLLTDTSAATDFKGKVITVVVPTAPGGGTDTFARLIALHLPRFIPGNPAVIVRNMEAAGGMTAANYVYAAKPNGLTLLATSNRTVLAQAFDLKGRKFKLENMVPIYASPQGMVFWSKKAVVKEPKDVMNGRIIYGGDSVVTSSTPFAWGKKLIGFKTEKVIVGYAGAGDAHLAFLSGEVNTAGGGAMVYNTTLKPYIDKGEVVGIFQTGINDENGNIVREVPDVPTVPELYEMIHGNKPTGTDMDVYRLLVSIRSYAKTLALPPETPEEIQNTYMDAVGKMVKDDKFLAMAERSNPGSLHYSGNKLLIAFRKSISVDPKVIKIMKQYLTDEYKVVFD
jgi:tripartite-type tricarboxylate transporter receptor subunit TctC